MVIMDEKELKRLIEKAENEKTEFKESLQLKDEICESVSAFSNSRGGVIFIGVSDNRVIKGISIGKKTISDLAEYIKKNTDPQVFPEIEVCEAEGKKIILIRVGESDDKPVFFKRHAYKRVGDTGQRISSSEIRMLAKEDKKKSAWDERICEGAAMSDIDEERVRVFLKEANTRRGLPISESASITDALTQLRLLKGKNPTNASILLFGKKPEMFFGQSEVKCIVLPSSDFVKPYASYKTYAGILFEQAEKAETFILENIRSPLWVEGADIAAKHSFEIPREAVREAVVNAIAHRDYETPSNVQVRIFPDRVEIWNPGKLPHELKADDLRKPHPSLPRNPLVFKQFYRVAFVEDVGGGTLDMIEKCKNAGLTEPVFEEKMGNFIVTLWRLALTEEQLEKIGLNERQKSALTHIRKQGKITRAEYEKLCNISERTANREIEEMLDKNIIEKRGKGSETYYVLARYGEIWRDKK